jgi:hypothetical protein
VHSLQFFHHANCLAPEERVDRFADTLRPVILSPSTKEAPLRISTFLLLIWMIAGCSKTVTYKQQIQPILNDHCVSCHNNDTPSGKVVLASYESLMSARTAGKVPLVTPGDPKVSRLYVLCATDQAHYRMPPDSSSFKKVPTEDLELIWKWIWQGAKND